jgi:hypothetical protein
VVCTWKYYVWHVSQAFIRNHTSRADFNIWFREEERNAGLNEFMTKLDKQTLDWWTNTVCSLCGYFQNICADWLIIYSIQNTWTSLEKLG